MSKPLASPPCLHNPLLKGLAIRRPSIPVGPPMRRAHRNYCVDKDGWRWERCTWAARSTPVRMTSNRGPRTAHLHRPRAHLAAGSHQSTTRLGRAADGAPPWAKGLQAAPTHACCADKDCR
eukprot:10187061-Alexandrium_andersonii.AAC.1